MKKSTFLKITGSLLLLNLPLISHAEHCDAHITNRLGTPWVVSFNTKIEEGEGNVHFSKDSGCPENGPCTINPGESVYITYSTTDTMIHGAMHAESVGGTASATVVYDNNDGDQKCPGHTDDINYVSFKDGDITILNNTGE